MRVASRAAIRIPSAHASGFKGEEVVPRSKDDALPWSGGI